MTWATTKDQGSGTLAFRLEIPGCTRSFVTHQSMIKPAATPPRIGGLTVSTGKLKAIANIASGELDVSGLSVRLTDLGEGTTGVFGRQPSARTWLTTNLTSSATTMAVRSTAAFASSGSLWLDSEALTYSGVTATTFTGLTRGALSTLAQAHYTDSGGSLRFPEVTSLPVTYAGRRAALYVYGENDDPQGNGTQIFRGIISREPTFRGAEWSLSIDPITSVLTRSLSADLAEPCQPRGIYYPYNRPFFLQVARKRTGTHQAYTYGDAEIGKVRFPYASGDTAFFETQRAFVDYLNTKLAAMVSDMSWTETIVAVEDGDSYHLQVSTPSSDVRGIFFIGPGGIDPVFSQPTTATGDIVDFLSASTTYAYRPLPESLPGSGAVPRGYYGDVFPLGPEANPDLSADYPCRRIYLGGASAISTLTDAVAISWKEFGASAEVEETTGITTTDLSNRFVVLARSRMPSVTNYFHGYVGGALPDIRLGRTYTSGGSLWTAINAIISAVPNGLNSGSVPDLQAGDFDSASWDDLDADLQPRIVRSRVIRSFADVTLADVVKEDLKLAGYTLGLSATGTLAIFPLRRPVTTEAGATTIDAFKVDKNEPTWSPAGVGMVNQILVRRGYDAISDDYTGSNVVVRDVAAFGQSPRPRTIKIEPKSTPSGTLETNAEIVEVASRIFGVLAHPYAIVSAEVGLRHFDSTTPGAAVSITSGDLPDTSDGTRGVTSLAGLVTGREVDLGDGRIALTIYVPLDRVSGYAPEAKLTGHVNTVGDTWELTCDTYTFASGTDASDWFEVDDEVQVFRWDSTTAGTLTGTVKATSGNVVTVEFASAFTPGADTWVLGYRDSANVEASQLAYVFMAESTGRIATATTDLDAWSFA